MPGPPPKDPSQRRRRNKDRAADPLTILPSAGYDGPVPDWPLAQQTIPEAGVWADLWRTPQAAAWVRLGWHRTVARYVRASTRAEDPEAPPSLMAEARQLEDRLGLSPMAMLRLRWKIADDEVAEARAERTAPAGGSRERLRAVGGT